MSGARAAKNRAALVETARRLLQERGFDRAGVAEISREAGLTQGALYGQFKSKDALAEEASRKAFDAGAALWDELQSTASDALEAYLDVYLSDDHARNVGSGCLIAACVSDIPRQCPAIGKVFAQGIAGIVERVQSALPASAHPGLARRRALTLTSSLVGSVALARAVGAVDPELSKEILAAARAELKAATMEQ